MNISRVDVEHENEGLEVHLQLVSDIDGIQLYDLICTADNYVTPQPITIKWNFSAINVKGVWKSGGLHNKRIQYDWELEHLQTRVSVDAPVVGVFGHSDENVMTFACSDGINLLEMNALLREEDNHVYCHLTFFKERHQEIKNYKAQVWIDANNYNYGTSLKKVSKWWETFEKYKPASTPPLALAPLYSTWYQFHQNLEEEVLLKECLIAKDLGYDLIIIDDGWQTLDSNRGYDYTGDWKPERLKNMSHLVSDIHAIGMKVGIWFSVPFCGKLSQAYQTFKGKFLTEDHRWAPVFDPRYPEVREHLINIYTGAFKNWDIDAVKLDFIDDFRVYPDTVLTKEDGRDYASVNDGVYRLLSDVHGALTAIKPDVAIEFRQRYIGPAMRRFGNMFRAFDAPNDPVSNKIRIVDVKLLCGQSAVHSDMIKWHEDEPVEIAALQVLNGLYGVPQMSMKLEDTSDDHMAMIRYYNNYWIDNADLFMNGSFIAHQPLANYPLLSVSDDKKYIATAYEPVIIELPNVSNINVHNASMSPRLVLRSDVSLGQYNLKVIDCQGHIIEERNVTLAEGVMEIIVPAAGMIQLELLEHN